MQRSKRVIRNIFQLLVGGIMLFMSYNYVKAHDAEKTNFISGISILQQKLTLMMQNIFGDTTTQQFQRHQEMIRNYKELLSYLRDSKCTISVSVADMEKKLALLAALQPQYYAQQAIDYSTYAGKVYQELQQCTKKQ